jgi:hypothetical protein
MYRNGRAYKGLSETLPDFLTGPRRGAPMNEQRIAEELLSLLEANRVKIRREPLGGRGGGLAVMKGESLFFVDVEATSAETAARCAEAVVKVLDIEKVYLRPEVRQYVEDRTGSGF